MFRIVFKMCPVDLPARTSVDQIDSEQEFIAGRLDTSSDRQCDAVDALGFCRAGYGPLSNFTGGNGNKTFEVVRASGEPPITSKGSTATCLTAPVCAARSR
jgi:hypothetical protein